MTGVVYPPHAGRDEDPPGGVMMHGKHAGDERSPGAIAKPSPGISPATNPRSYGQFPERELGVCVWLDQVLFELVAGLDSELAERFA
jgi:hypothetical protein